MLIQFLKAKYMNIASITYKTKIATEEEIFLHLKECSCNFIPHLDETVNIQEYSRKIFLNSITFEAWERNSLIGLLAAYLNDNENKVAYITNVSVMREYFGLGIASQLVRMCIDYTILINFSTMLLEVYEANTPALNLYQKYGFKIVGRNGGFAFMQLEITSNVKTSVL
jgi:ribosomal protein S18 acetylase RimI-like enzyme